MIKTIIVKNAKSDAENLRNSSNIISDELIQRTKGIMEDVEKYGDSAIIDYEEKFDGVRLNSLKVTDEEMKEAYNKVTKKQIQSIKMIRNRLIKTEISLFKQLHKISLSWLRSKDSAYDSTYLQCWMLYPWGKSSLSSVLW